MDPHPRDGSHYLPAYAPGANQCSDETETTSRATNIRSGIGGHRESITCGESVTKGMARRFTDPFRRAPRSIETRIMIPPGANSPRIVSL